jgi:DNA-directed RNA polymerase specialized sigma subunit
MTKRRFDVLAHHEGRWWVFEIPELGKTASNGQRMLPVGQARSAAKVAEEAHDLAAIWLDVDTEGIEVSVEFDLPAEVEEAQQRAAQLEEQGREAISEAARLRREAVRTLLESDLSQVDAATVLGISRQRVQQLGE